MWDFALLVNFGYISLSLQHNSGKTPSTKRYLPLELVWFAEVPSREAALQLVRKLKNITSKARVEDFIQRNSNNKSSM
ncbi:MAG: hypothetical protein LW750_01515 [Bacteroidetes bacterium]|jgi:predicted GIY-YIG superfamily endonuclease|nr:hypothetical protein [Bacteroidota bacterium]